MRSLLADASLRRFIVFLLLVLIVVLNGRLQLGISDQILGDLLLFGGVYVGAGNLKAAAFARVAARAPLPPPVEG